MFGSENGDEEERYGLEAIYKGDVLGNWGVTTNIVNPINHQRFISVFDREGAALDYARRRARTTGPRKIDGIDNPDFKPYYVAYMPTELYESEGEFEGDRVLEFKYRVLYGFVTPRKRINRAAGHRRPGRERMGTEREVHAHASLPSIMVFENEGRTMVGGVRWVLNRSLSTLLPQDDE